jgi:hypothetical protein
MEIFATFIAIYDHNAYKDQLQEDITAAEIGRKYVDHRANSDTMDCNNKNDN